MREKNDRYLNISERRKLKKEIYNRLKTERWLQDKKYLYDKAYLECVYDIMSHEKFKEMDNFIQHGSTTTLDHCLEVSYVSYKICRSYRLDYRSAARGALLHDFFLYDWHNCVKETGNHLHGLTHPKVAHDNAVKYFDLNEKERDIILKHMWPLTVEPPKSVEALIVSYTDKYCGALETIETVKRFGRVVFVR